MVLPTFEVQDFVVNFFAPKPSTLNPKSYSKVIQLTVAGPPPHFHGVFECFHTSYMNDHDSPPFPSKKKWEGLRLHRSDSSANEKKGIGICSTRSMETILRMLSTLPDFSSAQRMERTLQHSLPGDSLPFFLEKDRRGLSFIFQDAGWKEWGGFSSAPSQDVGDSSTMGRSPAFLRENKVGDRGMLLFSHLSGYRVGAST